jgi:chromosome segregation ATPase
VIEAFMYVALGGLTAAFAFIAIIPAIHRRANRLAKKRMIALFPLSVDELTAEKDGIRAEYALKQLKLEQKISHLTQQQTQHMSALGKSAIHTTKLEDMLKTGQQLVEEMKAHIQQLTSDLTLQKSMLEPMNAQLTARGTEIYAKQMKIEQNDQELAHVQNIINTKNSVIAGFEAQLAKANTHLQDLKSQLKQRDGALVKANSRVVGLEQAVSNETQFAKALKDRVQEMETFKEQQTKTLSEKTRHINKLTKTLNETSEDYETTLIERDTARTELEAVSLQWNELKTAFEELTHHNTAALQNLADLNHGHETLSVEYAEQKDKLIDAQSTLQEQEKTLSTREKELKVLQKNHTVLTQSHDTLSHMHEELTEAHQRMSDKHARALMDIASQNTSIQTLTTQLTKAESTLKKQAETLAQLQKNNKGLNKDQAQLSQEHMDLLKAHETLQRESQIDQASLAEAIALHDKAEYKSAEAMGKAKELARLMELRTTALESAKGSIASLETMLSDERQNVAALKEKIASVTKSYKDQTRQSKVHEQSLQEISTDVEGMSAQITRHTATIAQKDAELLTLKVTLSNVEKQLQDLKKSLKGHETTASEVIEDLKEEISTLKKGLEKTKTERTTYLTELNAMKAEQEKERAMRDAATREFSKRMANAFTPDSDDLDLNTPSTPAPTTEMKQKINDLKGEIAGLEASLKKTRADREFLKTELVSLRSENESARQAVEADNAELRQRIEDIAEIILTLVEEDENAFEVITLPVYSESANG